MQRRTFIRNGLATAAFLGCGAVAFGSGYGRHDVQVTKTAIHLGLVSPLRVIVLADIHFDPLYETGYLDTVFHTAAAQSPDLVLYAGDYITHTALRFEEFAKLSGILRPPLGSFAAFGNHDHRDGSQERIRQVLGDNGVNLLCNAIVPLPRNPGWTLAGLDSFLAGQPDPNIFAQKSRDTQFISIVHEPDAWDYLADPRIRLQVSGHTHGGQIRAPLLGAISLPTMGKKYQSGLFRRHESYLYVTRGIGTNGIPCRMNCDPEISVLDLS